MNSASFHSIISIAQNFTSQSKHDSGDLKNDFWNDLCGSFKACSQCALCNFDINIYCAAQAIFFQFGTHLSCKVHPIGQMFLSQIEQ